MTIAEFHAHIREQRRKVEQTLADRYGEQPPKSTGDRKRAQELNHWKQEVSYSNWNQFAFIVTDIAGDISTASALESIGEIITESIQH